MVVCTERAAMLAERVQKLVSLRKTNVAEKKVAIAVGAKAETKIAKALPFLAP